MAMLRTEVDAPPFTRFEHVVHRRRVSPLLE